MDCDIQIGVTGLPFNENGEIVYFCLTRTQLTQILCHGLSSHGVGRSGGFYGGDNSEIAGRGVAIGKNAKVIRPSAGDSIDAVQIGEGENKEHRTVKIYNWRLLDRYGKIPKERLPEDPNEVTVDPIKAERKSTVISNATTVIDPKYEKFLIDTTNNHVDVILPEASEVDGLGFYFRLFKQGVDGFAFKLERSYSDIIKIGKHADQGDYEEWLGITCDAVGTWFYIVACNNNYYLVSESDITMLNNVV